jgi:hypothetical protein
MKKIFTLVLMMVGLFATSVQANEVCDTIEDCQSLKARVERRLAELLNEVTSELTGILNTGLIHYEAERICKEKNMRLPTARELVLEAIARKVLPLDAISETRQAGYRHIRGTDAEGNPDDFYLNDEGYQRPEGNLGRFWVWSSSLIPDDSLYAYIFGGYSGDVSRAVRSIYNSYSAVRCVRSLP